MSVAPQLKAPAGACDTHMHIYEARYAFAPTAIIKPAPLSAYHEIQKQLGLERVVVVQPSGYGFDNACTLQAVTALGANARCVVVPRPDASDAELQKLDTACARGVRYFMLPRMLMPNLIK